MPEEDTMTVAEVMKELGISRTTLYKRIRDGDIVPLPPTNTAYKRQRVLRFRREDVERIRTIGGQPA